MTKGGVVMHIPVRSLAIGEAESEQLEMNLWRDRYVQAALHTNGRTTPVKIRYRGGHTRGYPKRSYEVVRKGQTFHYNAEFDDPSMIRNALSFWFLERLGVPSPRTKHVLLVRNGISLGVYLEIEAVERGFFRRRGIGARSLFYAVNNRADFGVRDSASQLSGYEYRFGEKDEKARLASFIRGIHRTPESRLAAYLDRNLDVDNYLKWLAGAVLTGNFDGFEQNYSLYRHHASGKWRIVPWDYEGTWGRNCYGRAVESDLVDIAGYNHLTEKVLKHRPYMLRYKRILRKALDETFTEKTIMRAAAEMHGSISPYVRRDRLQQWPYEQFLGEPNVIRNYIRERRAIVASALSRL